MNRSTAPKSVSSKHRSIQLFIEMIFKTLTKSIKYSFYDLIMKLMAWLWPPGHSLPNILLRAIQPQSSVDANKWIYEGHVCFLSQDFESNIRKRTTLSCRLCVPTTWWSHSNSLLTDWHFVPLTECFDSLMMRVAPTTSKLSYIFKPRTGTQISTCH